MTFNTTIQPSGHSFPIEAHETVLEAALKHGYTLPYSCRDGVCGTCKGKVVSGRVDYGKHQESTLSEDEKSCGHGIVLLRQAAFGSRHRMPRSERGE